MKTIKKRKPLLPVTNGFGEPSAFNICMNWFNGYSKFPKGLGEVKGNLNIYGRKKA